MDYAEALAVLDLKPGATAAEIGSAYKAAVLAWHPDRFGSADMKTTAQARLKRINEACAVLTAAPRRDAANSGGDGPSYRDNNVWYRGGDPRLPPVGLFKTLVRGIGVEAIVSPDGVAIAGHAAVKFSGLYPSASVWSISQAGQVWEVSSNPLTRAIYEVHRVRCVLIVADPNEVMPSLSIALQFRNAYHAGVFAKKVVETYGMSWVGEVKGGELRVDRG